MPLALAIGLWMAPPGTKLTPTAPDTGCPGLARPDLTHAYTPLCYGLAAPLLPLLPSPLVALWFPGTQPRHAANC